MMPMEALREEKLDQSYTLIWDWITYSLIVVSWVFLFILWIRARTVGELVYAVDGSVFMALMGIALALIVNFKTMKEESFSSTGTEISGKDVEVGIVIVLFSYLGIFLFNLYFISTYGGSIVSFVGKGDALILTLAASVNEEMFFRVGIMMFLMKLFPDYDDPFVAYFMVIPAVSVLFSTLHFAVYASAFSQPRIYLMVLGYACGASYFATRRPWVPMGLHLLNNLVVVLLVV